ncbi:hypothetical protein CVT25_013782 [Psilocybe cyanescens]|uniref:Cytochrome P450 n=1 Tax=Psilocybe cyanescens TaxID=93625 RepID=A0A409WTS4_PSICY|nr:hypothetical protein CVT25_013782 [Psilocybe cyanescens]
MAPSLHVDFSHVALTLAFVYVVSKIVDYRRGLQTVSSLPGLRVPFYPLGMPGAIIPTSWWNPGLHFTWLWRDSVYKRFGFDTISVVSFISGAPAFYTADLSVARQVLQPSEGRSYWKSEVSVSAIIKWGMNLLAADGGDIWRRHRRVVGPAFNNDLYKLVWRVTVSTYREMVDVEGFADNNECVVPEVQTLTFKLALLLIGRCAFGFPFNWADPATTADGKMMRESVEAEDCLMGFLKALVKERKSDFRSQHMDDVSNKGKDAFSMLVKASMDEGAKYTLDDDELVGNIFIMLFAGHESTAHVISATLGFLSLYDDLQQEVYDQIITVVGHERDPVFEDYNALDKVLSAFFEALRMFPPGFIAMREAFEDTALQIPNPNGVEGETVTIPIAKGTQVIVDITGMQYNPRYFEKPFEFMPSRWKGCTVESEAVSAFSVGPRTCIGRKFATTEAVCFLTMLLRDFKIEPLLQPGESKQAWKSRVLDASITMTLGVKPVPVKFIRRKQL